MIAKPNALTVMAAMPFALSVIRMAPSRRRTRRRMRHIARIASRTFFGAISNMSGSIEYEARPLVSERIAVE